MGVLLDFQFVVVLNLLVLALWPASSPYLAPRTADAGSRFPTSPIYIILAVLTALAVILDIVFLAGGHAH